MLMKLLLLLLLLPLLLLPLQLPEELRGVLSRLQSIHPHLLPDTCAMADALEGLTVTAREATAALLTELGVEVNRKLLALQVKSRLMSMI
jgi:hypothetical protein